MSLAALAALEEKLGSDERHRAARFRLEEDRKSFIAAHALKRQTLSDLSGCPPTDWRFGYTSSGQPWAKAHGAQQVAISLSHTPGLAAFAVSTNDAIGIDCEWTARPAPMGVAWRYFAPAERSMLASLPEAEQGRAFYRIWTLKEAIAKGVGRGLSLGLDTYAFDLDPIRLLGCGDDDPKIWAFEQTWIGTEHVLALACRESLLG